MTFFFLDYAKYYESLSNNAAAETYKPMDEDADDDNEMFEVVGTEEINTQEPAIDTFEETVDSAEDFEEDEDIPLVSGKLLSKIVNYVHIVKNRL